MAHWSFSASYFLFGGIVFFNFTVISLLIVCCSRRYHSRNLANDTHQQEEKPREQLPVNIADEACPEQIVVIMAGDQSPSFIAMPSPSPRSCCPEEQV